MGNITNLKYINFTPQAQESVNKILCCLLSIDFDNTPTEVHFTSLAYDSNNGILKVKIILYSSPNSINVYKVFRLNVNNPFMTGIFRKELINCMISSDDKYMINFVQEWIAKNGLMIGNCIRDSFKRDGCLNINFGNDKLLLKLPIGMKSFEYEVLLKAYFYEQLRDLDDMGENYDD